MLCHALKRVIELSKGCPYDLENRQKIDTLWLHAQSLLAQAEKELDKALPFFRRRSRQPDPAYEALLRIKKLLYELDNT